MFEQHVVFRSGCLLRIETAAAGRLLAPKNDDHVGRVNYARAAR